MKYSEELKRTMEHLSKKDDIIFIGQAVNVPGTAMSNTLKDIDNNKLLELPVAEEMQMGMAIGMALNEYIPVCIYPRWNFLLLAVNQIVNHLDKISEISNHQYNCKVIIRTAVGSERPLNPQAQHSGDFTNSFKDICKSIDVIKLENPANIFEAYEYAYKRQDNKSSLIVEVGDYYNTK